MDQRDQKRREEIRRSMLVLAANAVIAAQAAVEGVEISQSQFYRATQAAPRFIRAAFPDTRDFYGFLLTKLLPVYQRITNGYTVEAICKLIEVDYGCPPALLLMAIRQDSPSAFERGLRLFAPHCSWCGRALADHSASETAHCADKIEAYNQTRARGTGDGR